MTHIIATFTKADANMAFELLYGRVAYSSGGTILRDLVDFIKGMFRC